MAAASVADALRRLASGNRDGKRTALMDLAATDGTSPEAARAILDSVADSEIDLRSLKDAMETHRGAIRELGAGLLAELRSPDADTRVKALRAIRFRHVLLAPKEPRDPAERKAVLCLSSDPDPDVRHEVCGYLGGSLDPPECVHPWLEVFLRDPDPQVRERAADEVAIRGRSALPLVPAVARLLADPDPGVRGVAAKAVLGWVAVDPGILEEPVPGAGDPDVPHPTVRALVVSLLASRERECVLPALKVLGNLPALTSGEIRALEPLFGHEDPDVRALARVLSFPW